MLTDAVEYLKNRTSKNTTYILQLPEENLQVHPFQYYISVYNEAKRLSNLPTAISSLPPFAMNMGIFGCNCDESLGIVKNYCELVKSYIIKQQQKKHTELYNYCSL